MKNNMKTQMYLTPSQVEVLRGLGVEFERSILHPRLHEVLEKLPTSIPDNDDLTFYGITVSFDERGKWLASYRNNYDMYIKGTLFYNPNPLLAAFELLKWVAINHPDKIK